MEDDIKFTFDELPFLQGLDKITKALENFGSAAIKTAQTAGKGLMSFVDKSLTHGKAQVKNKVDKGGGAGGGVGAWAMAKGMMIFNVFAAIFRKIVNMIKTGIPEIGKTFSIVSDIFSRNFLWPLRKELAPYLQKILDWARDSRGAFVRWGGYLVNIFRIIKQVIIGVVETAKQFAAGFVKIWQGAVGKTNKTFSDFMNLLVLKMAGTMIFIQAFMEPIWTAIGKVIGFLAVGIRGFFKGISDGVDDVLEPLTELRELLTDLVEELFGDADAAKAFGLVMEGLGDIIGVTVVTAVEALIIVVRTLVMVLKEAFYLLKAVFQEKMGDFAGAQETYAKMEKIGKDWYEGSKKQVSRTGARFKRFDSRMNRREDELAGIVAPEETPATRAVNVNNSRNVKQDLKVHINQLTVESKSDTPAEHGRQTAYMLEQQLRNSLMGNRYSMGAYPTVMGK